MQSTRQSKTSPTQAVDPSQSCQWLKEVKSAEERQTKKARGDIIDATVSLLAVIAEDTRLKEEAVVPAHVLHNALIKAQIELLGKCKEVGTSIEALQKQMLAFNIKYTDPSITILPQDVISIKNNICTVDRRINELAVSKKAYNEKKAAYDNFDSVKIQREFKALDLSLIPTRKLIQAIKTKMIGDKATKALKEKMEKIYDVLSTGIPDQIEDYNKILRDAKYDRDINDAYDDAKNKIAEDFDNNQPIQITKKQMAAEQRATASASNPHRLHSPKVTPCQQQEPVQPDQYVSNRPGQSSHT